MVDIDTEERMFANPFRPGAGHQPPHLAGRHDERSEFVRLLGQKDILENLILTGLRGVGKTVLLDSLRPVAQAKNWLWVGADLSEAATLSEERIVTRLLTDLSLVTSQLTIPEIARRVGFAAPSDFLKRPLDHHTLWAVYESTPGLVADKLKRVLQLVWEVISSDGILATEKVNGIVFAYDEAQNLSDQAIRDEYPLSLLLDTFQSIQKQGIPFMLVLTGLPTLFPKLVQARAFAERMFHVRFLDRLPAQESREAIVTPMERDGCPVQFTEVGVETIIETSGGYPYFIQFICREVYEVFTRNPVATVPIDGIVLKLDTDFFAGRWGRATDRQRQLLWLVAQLEEERDGVGVEREEFTVQDVVEMSKKKLSKPFSGSHVNQMLSTLCNQGLVYKNRHGKYCFAVPLLGRFILRQSDPN